VNSDTPGTAFRKLIEGLGRGGGGEGNYWALKLLPLKLLP